MVHSGRVEAQVFAVELLCESLQQPFHCLLWVVGEELFELYGNN